MAQSVVKYTWSIQEKQLSRRRKKNKEIIKKYDTIVARGDKQLVVYCALYFFDR
jgi:hypothetical protein